MQKTTEDEENIFLSGFPPEFREWQKRRSLPLNASIILKSLIPECLYQESKLLKGENIWIPARISGMTEGEVIPERFYEESK